MDTCSLEFHKKFPFQGTDPDRFLVTTVKVYRKEIASPIQIYAKIDTGFTRSLLVGDVLGRRLRDILDIAPDETNQTLWALGIFGVPCDVYYLHLQLPGMTKWARVRAYLPQGTSLVGNIVGMELLKHTYCCVRGPELEVGFAGIQKTETGVQMQEANLKDFTVE